jgi:hypothetical protein
VVSYVYNEKKGYLIGLPARDLSEDEWKELPEELTKSALKLGIYKKLQKTKEVNNGA